MTLNKFSIYQPLGRKNSSFENEESARVYFNEVVGDAVLMERGRIIDKKQYITGFDELVHAALNFVCNEKKDMPDSRVISIYRDVLGLFKNSLKGVMITGSVGVGKTTIMKVISVSAMSGYIEDVKPFRVLGVRKIAKSFMSNGYETYKELQIGEGFPHNNTCIDDVGIEATQLKLFGNNVALLPDLIMEMYDNFTSKYRTRTHFTTNLLPDEIEAAYGTRVFDRMVEMTNLYAIEGETKRI